MKSDLSRTLTDSGVSPVNLRRTLAEFEGVLMSDVGEFARSSRKFTQTRRKGQSAAYLALKLLKPLFTTDYNACLHSIFKTEKIRHQHLP